MPNGQELQYLLVSNPPEQPVWRSAQTLAVAPVETPTLKTSGFEIDLGQPLVVDRCPGGGDLRAVSQTRSPRRQRRSHAMDAARGRGHVIRSAGGTAGSDRAGVRARFVSLLFASRGTTREAAVCPGLTSLRCAKSAMSIPPPPLTTALTFERRPSEPGRGQFRVRLPLRDCRSSRSTSTSLERAFFAR